MQPLDIGLLGGFSIARGADPVRRLGSSRAEVLLAYLLIHRALPQSRRQLAFLFWPESAEGQAHTNLRRELHRLRRLVPDADRLLDIGEHSLGLKPETALRLDVVTFEEALAAADRARGSARLEWLTTAIEGYRGDLLPELYDEWVSDERERLRQRYRAALLDTVRELELQRRYAEALPYARRLVRLDPLKESAYLSLMRLLALNGDQAEALAVYGSCASLLDRELAVGPGPELQEAYRRLQSTSHSGQRARSQAPQRERMVGRETEWQAFLESWRTAASGPARASVLLGEAGIGKTRLAEELVAWAAQQGYRSAEARCYRAEGRLAFAPVVDWFREPAIAASLSALERSWLREVARLLPELLPDAPEETGAPAPVLSESWQRRRLFEALARAVLTVRQPLLLLLDDAQWSDPETLDWLHYLLRFDASARLLLVLTVRTEEQADNRSLDELLVELRRRGLLDEIALGPLDRPATGGLAAQVLGRALGEQESLRLYEVSEGHPLFVVEMARAALLDADSGDEPVARDSRVPRRAQAVITARLSRLSPTGRELAGLAATVGRRFSSAVLAAAGDWDEKDLVAALDELWRRRIVREHGADEYDFSHDRIREIAYAELGQAPRRYLHKRVAEALERIDAGRLDEVSVQVAGHYELAGHYARAIHFYRRGAEVARRVSASSEAIRLLRHALGLLPLLPASHERDRLELGLQYALSAPINATLGYASPELEASLRRVRELGERLGEGGAVVGSLVGLFAVHFVQGDSRGALRVAEEAVQFARQEPPLLPGSLFALGGALFSLGRFDESLHNFELAADGMGDDSSSLVFGADLAVFRHSYASHALWHLGWADRALNSLDLALERAERLANPYNLALAHAYAALANQFMGDVARAKLHADSTRSLCDRYGYAYYGEWGTIVRGWVRALEGEGQEGLVEIERGLSALGRMGAAARRPYYLSLLAEVLCRLGRVPEAEAVLEEALESATRFGDVWWNAELLRFRGELIVRAGGSGSDAEQWLDRAVEVAREQGSRALLLRCRSSLVRLQPSKGARRSLRRAYLEVTAAAAHKDLREARALLGDED